MYSCVVWLYNSALNDVVSGVAGLSPQIVARIYNNANGDDRSLHGPG